MAKRKKQKQYLQWIIGILIIIIGVIVYPFLQQQSEEHKQNLPVVAQVNGELQMHTIDVGQGDSILFLQENKVMLVDTGSKSEADKVIEYMENLGITKIDILIGTHPHEDHMGAMIDIIHHFDIGILYTPDNTKDNITAKWYLNFLDEIMKKKINWQYSKLADTFTLGQATVQVISPSVEQKSELNNSSIALKVSFGETDILLTGDAEKQEEQAIIDTGLNIQAEIYKVAHHGSDTSSTLQFLDKVQPQYAIISVGKDNSYGLPDKEVVNRLKEKGVTIYRTDQQGNIIMRTDGNNIIFN